MTESPLRKKADDVLHAIGILASEVEELQRLFEAENEHSHPHDVIWAGTIKDALERLEIPGRLLRLDEEAREIFPEVSGEIRLHLHKAISRKFPHLMLSDEDAEADETDDERLHADPRVRWDTFDVGIGGGGIEILITFVASVGTAVTANLVSDYLRQLKDRGLRPTVDGPAAIAICQGKLLAEDPQTKLGHAYAKPTDISHARYEVVLHADDGKPLYRYLVRPDGEVCGTAKID